MKNSVTLASLLLITGLLWSVVVVPSAQLDWTEDANFGFSMTMNGVSTAGSNTTNPIYVDPASDLIVGIWINASAAVYLRTGLFSMEYLGIPLFSSPIDYGDIAVSAGTVAQLSNSTIPLGALLSYGGISLVTGTILGHFSMNYSLQSDPSTTVRLAHDFVLYLGSPGLGSIMSVVGLLTVGFTVMSVFGLLISLDHFQQGISAARKMRRGKTAAGIGIFPSAVVLRRKPKKDAEKISKEELVKRVGEAARSGWDGKSCPKCGKKWGSNADACSKCKIEKAAAVTYFSEDIAEYAPKALNAVAPKSKVPVSTFSKRLHLKPAKGGALAAALTEMGVFQTKSVKIPLKKVAFSGLALAGTYWSWMQLLNGAIPGWLDVLLTTAAGLVVSVLIGYFMKWLARVPRLGYDK